MKKITLLLLSLAAFCWQTNAQVQVGSGNSTTTTNPITSCYGYTYSQQVYLASDINASGSITSLSFYINSATSTADFTDSDDWVIYLGHSTKTTYASTTDWEDVANLTESYNGTITFPTEDNWVTITLDTPFAYNGSDNLVVAIDENSASWDCTMSWTSSTTTNSKAIYYRNDSTNPDPTSPPTATGISTNRPDIIFGGISQACANPSVLTATAITTTSAALGWTENGTASLYNVEVVTAGITPTGTATDAGVANGFTKSGLSANTPYEYYVQADCTGGALSAWVGPFAFSTLCDAVSTFPWTEDFEGISIPDLPICWDENNENADGDFWKTWGNFGVGGSNAAGLYTDFNSGANDDYLILPQFTLTGGERLKYSVRARSAGEPNDYKVVLSTTGKAAADFSTDLKALTTVSSTTYAEEILDLSAYSGDVYIAIHVPNGGLDGYYIYFDEFTLEAIPSCLAPSALTASNIIATQADLSWTENGTASLYNVEVVTAGTTPTGTATDNGVANGFTKTMLTANMAYEYYVQADCTGGDLSAWVGPFAFNTLCNTFTAPYTQDFENAGTIPSCWNSSSSSTRVWAYATSPTFGNSYSDNTSGTGYFAFVDASTSVTTTDATLVSPFIDVTSLTTPALEFYKHHFANGGNSNTVTVEVYDGAAWNVVHTDNNGDINGWEKVLVDLSTLTITGDIQVRFIIDTATNSNYENDIAIDDISVIEAPTCLEPSALMATVTSYTEAELTWTDNASVSLWDIEVVDITAGGTATGTPTYTGVTTNPYALSSLTAENDYEFYVRADCAGSGTSNWVGPIAFTTDYCSSVPISNDGTGISNLQLATTDFQSGGDITYEDFRGSPVDLAQGITANVVITFMTDFTYGTNIWIDLNDNLVFEASELMYTGESPDSNTGTDILDASFVMPAAATLGQHRMRIVTDDTNSDATNPCNSSTYGVTMDVDVNIIMASCSPPVATAAISADCANSQFYIDINVTALGDGTPTIEDGTTSTPVTAVGTIQVGPYADGANITLYINHGTDATCDLPLGSYTNTCPPANDLCAGAIALTAGTDFAANQVIGSNLAATGSGETPLPSCSLYDPTDSTGFGGDLWYSVVVPVDGNLTIETDNNGGPSTDSGMQVYSGSCGSLVAVECDDDDGNGFFSQVIIETTDGLAGETLLVRVFEYSGDSQMNFLISAYSATLSTSDLEDNAAFTYFPNPVKNTLTLNAKNTIDIISIFNVLGQEVLRATPNTVNSELNMSSLKAGAYFVNVTIANTTKTIKVIKQ